VPAAQRALFNQQVESTMGQSVYNSYVQTEKDASRVKYYTANGK
jgi:hypothetical protein